MLNDRPDDNLISPTSLAKELRDSADEGGPLLRDESFDPRESAELVLNDLRHMIESIPSKGRQSFLQIGEFDEFHWYNRPKLEIPVKTRQDLLDWYLSDLKDRVIETKALIVFYEQNGARVHLNHLSTLLETFAFAFGLNKEGIKPTIDECLDAVSNFKKEA